MVISATAHNAGRLDAFIAKVTLRWSGSSEGGNPPKRHSWDVPAEHVPGLSGFPKALPAQTDFQFSIADLPGLHPSLNVALHEKRWAQLVVQTASCQKARRKIKYK